MYGHFDDARREYVITTPLLPRPWLNYLGCEDFFSLVSHTGGGYCFYKDARLRRLLRYRYNTTPVEAGGRYFYIRDGEDFWNPTYLPSRRDLDRYECRHGLGYTRITAARGGIEAEQLLFVPIGHAAEVHRLTLTNRSAAPRTLTVFSFVEFCLWNALDDATNLQRNLSTGEVEVDGATIYHTTEYRERRDHFAFYHSSEPAVGFDTDRESFVGTYETMAAPAAVALGRSRNSVASGWAPIASHCHQITLEPGESRTMVFVLGYVENHPSAKWERPGVVDKTRARAMIDELVRPEAVDRSLALLEQHWASLLSRLRVSSPDPTLDRVVNTWNPYQVMATFNVSRSASAFETGIGRGIGFRDSNQDLLGFVHLVPDRARQRILDLAATQLADGSAYHQYRPLTRRGNNEIGSGFNDDPLWLVLSVAAYVKETDDYAILEEPVAFDNDTDKAAPLFEHLRRSMLHCTDRVGPHGLPLIGRADWNDCLNLNCFSTTPDESFQTTGNRNGKVAESVFIAAMFVLAGTEYAELARRSKREADAVWAEQAIASMTATVRAHGWDGAWFLRAYDHFGHKVGSRECDEGRIFIEPQGMCVMAGIGVDDGMAKTALDSVKEHLDSPYGIVLVHPAYTRYRSELGEITSYPPGYKENGGVFCHNNPWVIIAETILGRADMALEYYRKITPAYLEDRTGILGAEPYVYSQMIAGPEAPRAGEAKNSWLTGAAAWALVAATQRLFGVRPDYDGLVVDPCLPDRSGEYVVRRVLRGAEYRIHIHGGGPRSGLRVRVGGNLIRGNVVPYAPAGSRVEIDCDWPETP